MSIKIEKTKNTNELKLEFTVEAKLFEDAMKKVYNKNAKYFSIPGFRKGKVPYNIIEKHYGKEMFYEDAFNELIPEIYDREIKENNIQAVNSPKIDVVQMEKGKDLIFTAIVQTKPEVKLGQYKGIEINKIEYNVSEEDVEKEIEKMAEQNARLISIEDRPVEEKDIVYIDFEGSIDGIPFDGGKAKNYELVIGSHKFVEGFEEQIIGMKIEEEREIKVKFPDDYISEEIEGKEAIFKVKLNEIKKKELPKIDDEFAKDVSEFDTLKELKKDVKEKIKEKNNERAQRETNEAVTKAVASNTEIDIPSGMIEIEVNRRIEELKTNLQYSGLSLSQYLEIVKKTEGDLKKEYKESSTEAIKVNLILEAIAKEEKLEPNSEDVENKLTELSKTYAKTVEELKQNEELINYINNSLKLEKAVEFIVKNAIIK